MLKSLSYALQVAVPAEDLQPPGWAELCKLLRLSATGGGQATQQVCEMYAGMSEVGRRVLLASLASELQADPVAVQTKVYTFLRSEPGHDSRRAQQSLRRALVPLYEGFFNNVVTHVPRKWPLLPAKAVCPSHPPTAVRVISQRPAVREHLAEDLRSIVAGGGA